MKQRNSFNVQSYMPATQVANLLLSFKKANLLPPVTFSSMVRRCVDIIVENTVPLSERFTDTELALGFLELCGFSVSQVNNPNRNKALARQLNEESVIEGFSLKPGGLEDTLDSLLEED